MKLNQLRQIIREELASMDGDKEMDKTAQDLFNKLESILKTHDWTYFMSDDHRAYKNGEYFHNEIISLMKQLKDFGYGEKAEELYKTYNK